MIDHENSEEQDFSDDKSVSFLSPEVNLISVCLVKNHVDHVSSHFCFALQINLDFQPLKMIFKNFEYVQPVGDWAIVDNITSQSWTEPPAEQ